MYKRLRKSKKYKRRRICLLIFCLLISTGILYIRQQYTKKSVKAQKDIKLNNKTLAVSKDKKQLKNTEVEKKDVKMIGTNEEGKKYTYDAKKIEEKLKKYDYSNDGEKIVFLTFDDGASITVTPEILKELDEADVKATFFVMGKNIEEGGERAKELIKQEFDSGHAIGNHSYSHNYSILYPNRVLNLEAFKNDFQKTDKLLKDILGDNFSTRVIRCPGGYMSWKGMEPLSEYVDQNNMAYIDWNSLSEDAEGRKKNADELVQCAIKNSEGKEIVVILMHDTYGKEETAKSLPGIIKYFKDNGYEFKTLS